MWGQGTPGLILVLCGCIWNAPSVSLVLPAFDDTGLSSSSFNTNIWSIHSLPDLYLRASLLPVLLYFSSLLIDTNPYIFPDILNNYSSLIFTFSLIHPWCSIITYKIFHFTISQSFIIFTYFDAPFQFFPKVPLSSSDLSMLDTYTLILQNSLVTRNLMYIILEQGFPIFLFCSPWHFDRFLCTPRAGFSIFVLPYPLAFW